MVHYSVLIPVQFAGDELERQLPQVVATLARLARPFEVICIDDASATAEQALALVAQYPNARVLRPEQPQGVSAALAVGITAARGDVVVAMQCGQQYAAEDIARLISYLSRADLVFGHRRRTGFSKLVQRLGRIPRWLVWGLDVRDPACLFWAARREAIVGLSLRPGMARHLPLLVRRRGYRVSEVYVRHRASDCPARDGWCRPADLWSALKATRQPRPDIAEDRPPAASESFIAAKRPHNMAAGGTGSCSPFVSQAPLLNS